VAIGGHVHAQNNTLEVHVHTGIISAHETTPVLTQVCPKTVEGDPESQNVEYVANE